MSDELYGTTIDFASGFFAEILAVNWSGMERGDVPTSHSDDGEEGWLTYDPSELKEPGELKIEFAFQPDETPPIEEPKEPVTITLPIPEGGNTGATWVCDGYLKSFEFGAPYDGKITGSGVVKFSGKPIITPGT